MRRLQIDKKLNDPIKMLSKTFYKGKGAPSDKKKVLNMGIIFIKDILKTVRQKGELLTIVGKETSFHRM